MSAALLAVGELGYSNVTSLDVIARAGEPDEEFQRHFADAGECFAAAYASEAKRLVDRLLENAAAQPSWRQGLGVALAELSAYVAGNPLSTRALVIDVHLAGDPATTHRAGLVERLSRALDRGRRHDDTPPALTAPFMVGAVEASIVSALVGDDPEAFARAVPELEQLIADAYGH